MEETATLKVSMSNNYLDENGQGWQFDATDYVLENDLDEYVADAKTRWNTVIVSNN